MRLEELIARFDARFPGNDPAAVFDFASAATEGDTVLVPLNYVDDLLNSLARGLERANE